ncbi:MAG: hypothetical protein IKD06_05095 [Clostridia bacterium]|nr:hypothetical protein [Clostridia bacterium]
MELTVRPLTKTVLALLLAAGLIFVGYQVSVAVDPGLQTLKALYATVNDSQITDGFVVRRESVLTANAVSVSCVYENGERVSKNSVLAYIYDSHVNSDLYAEIRSLDRRIDELNEVMAERHSLSGNLTALYSEIRTQRRALALLGQCGVRTEVDEATDELRTLLNKKAVILDSTVDYTPVIQDLKAEKKQLEKQASSYSARVLAPQAGYFSSLTDGFESLLIPEDLDTLTPADLDTLRTLQPAPTANAVGKIVTDYEWYFVCNVDAKWAERLNVGSLMTLNFSVDGMTSLKGRLRSLSAPEDGLQTAVFSLTTLHDSFCDARRVTCEVVYKSYTGFRVPQNSLRMLEGVTGVYILRGSLVEFRAVTPTLYKDDFVIVRDLSDASSKNLSLYDEIIYGGKNLYVGKVIK